MERFQKEKSSMIDKIRHMFTPSGESFLSPRKARIKVRRKIPQSAGWSSVPDKTLSQRKLTKVEKTIVLLNRYFLKPLHLFQGTISAMTKTDIPYGESVRLEAQKVWAEFNEPNTAYVLLFRNTKGPMGGSEHAAVVLGSTEGKPIDDLSGYASWAFSSKQKGIGPFLKRHTVHSFIKDFETHGKPEIIKVTLQDMDQVKTKWQWIQSKEKFYRLIGMNCSTVGHRLLRHGLGLKGRREKHLVTPKGYWTPRDLMAFAESARNRQVPPATTPFA